jgi:spore coat polysaccharide biosynthesis predicted glycosyltransferase SpsG
VVSNDFRDLPLPDPDLAPYIVVSLGGADPGKISTQVAENLAHCLEARRDSTDGIEVKFVLGPAFGERPELEALIEQFGWSAERTPSRAAFAQLLHGATFAVLGFGISVYEAAYLGVPAIYITHHTEDIAGALRLEQLGLGHFGANVNGYEPVRLSAALGRALDDPDWRGRARRRAQETMGRSHGALRILAELGLIFINDPGPFAADTVFKKRAGVIPDHSTDRREQ